MLSGQVNLSNAFLLVLLAENRKAFLFHYYGNVWARPLGLTALNAVEAELTPGGTSVPRGGTASLRLPTTVSLASALLALTKIHKEDFSFWGREQVK